MGEMIIEPGDRPKFSTLLVEGMAALEGAGLGLSLRARLGHLAVSLGQG